MQNCLFCKMVRKEMTCKIEYEDSDLLAIHDIAPQAPVHLLVVPKKHVAQISDLEESDRGLVSKLIYGAKEIARDKGWENYRLVLNNGSEAGQSVFHIHLHLLSGRRMQWPPG